MNPSSLELLRHSLLRQLAAALPASLCTDTLSLGLHSAGFSIDESFLNSELIYLTQRGLVELFYKPLNAASARYRLTADGRDYLQKEGLL